MCIHRQISDLFYEHSITIQKEYPNHLNLTNISSNKSYYSPQMVINFSLLAGILIALLQLAASNHLDYVSS